MTPSRGGIVLRNDILIYFHSVVVDENTSRAMSLFSFEVTPSNTADNDRRLHFPFLGYYWPLGSRNAIILIVADKVFSPW